MLIGRVILVWLAALTLAAMSFPARAEDVALSFGTADRITVGEQVEEEKRPGHEALAGARFALDQDGRRPARGRPRAHELPHVLPHRRDLGALAQ